MYYIKKARTKIFTVVLFITILILSSCGGDIYSTKSVAESEHPQAEFSRPIVKLIENATDNTPVYGNNQTNTTFNKGEYLLYKLSENGETVALITFDVLNILEYQGSMCYYVRAVIELSEKYTKLFNVNYKDTLYAYIDTETMLPKESMKFARQKNYKDDITIIFDQEAKTGKYISQRNIPEGKDFSWESGDLLYMLSAIYYIRAMKDISIDDEISLFMLDEKTLEPFENKLKAIEGDPYKGKLPAIDLVNISDAKGNVNSISMKIIDYKSKFWLPVSIDLSLKLGSMPLNLTFTISDHKNLSK